MPCNQTGLCTIPRCTGVVEQNKMSMKKLLARKNSESLDGRICQGFYMFCWSLPFARVIGHIDRKRTADSAISYRNSKAHNRLGSCGPTGACLAQPR